jgi:hypothetical protein
MVVLLVLLIITADGPKQTQLEQQSLDDCWIRAHALIEKADPVSLEKAGVVGIGAGCVVINVSQEVGR